MAMKIKKMPGRFLGPLLLGTLAIFVIGPAAAFADQVVYFLNGKAMMVKSVEKGEKLTILEMDGGGKIGVPTAQIAKIEEYQIGPPPGPIASVPITPPVAQAIPAPMTAPKTPGPEEVKPVQAAMPGPLPAGTPAM